MNEIRIKMSTKSASLARHIGIYENRFKTSIKSASLARHIGIHENVKWQIRVRSKKQ
jgi:hypothetical protein